MAESRRKQNADTKAAKASKSAPAEPVRRSKPRKVEIADDDEAHAAGHGLHLASYVTGGIAILLGMIIIATFLASPPVQNWALISFGVAALVTVALYLLGSLRTKRALN